MKGLKSLEREAPAADRRRVRVRRAMIGLSGVLVVILVLAVLALVGRNQAVDQRDRALSRQLAANATIQLAIDPELSRLLARQAFEISPTEEAEAVLRQRVRVTLRSHEGLVWGAAFNPDGQRVASAGADGTVRVWDLASGGAPVVLRGHQGTVWGAAFSPDGQRVVSASVDGIVRVWQWAGGEPVMLRGHQGAANAVAFSPDGRRVVSAGTDGTVRVSECEVCGPIEEVLELSEGRVTRELTSEERESFLHEDQRR